MGMESFDSEVQWIPYLTYIWEKPGKTQFPLLPFPSSKNICDLQMWEQEGEVINMCDRQRMGRVGEKSCMWV
jgi:hypothetical protein